MADPITGGLRAEVSPGLDAGAVQAAPPRAEAGDWAEAAAAAG